MKIGAFPVEGLLLCALLAPTMGYHLYARRFVRNKEAVGLQNTCASSCHLDSAAAKRSACNRKVSDFAPRSFCVILAPPHVATL
eukprot:4468047-Amphidinium_carterae.1